jgi:hypothetical protein
MKEEVKAVNEVEKLRVLIPHWIEHNNEHASEFQRWAETTSEAAPDLLVAAEAMKQVNQTLAIALEKLGGALPHPHSH